MTIDTMLSGPLAQAIGWALLHLLWQGVLVAAILAATLALLRQSANARYLASCGALLLLVVLGVGTVYRTYDPPAPPPIHPATFNAVTLAPAFPETVPASIGVAPSWSGVVSFVNAHLTQIVLAWLVGVLFLSIRLVFGWIGAHRLATRRSHAAAAQWEQTLERIAGALRLRRTVTLLESAAVEVPTVIGWLRPVILLPVATLSGLSTEQIEMILAHELAHIRRHDFIVNLLQSMVETLLFYHPAVWWISRRIRDEREHCCDDLAVAVFGNPVQYARALTRFEELRGEVRQTVLAANGGSLLARIRRLVMARAESASWSSRWAAGAALLTVAVALIVTPALPLLAQHENAKSVPQKPPKAHAVATTHPSANPECDKPKTKKLHAEVDVEAPQPELDYEVITPEPDPASAPTPMVTPRPYIVPRATVAVAPAVASAMAVADAVAGGVVGGVVGGVMGRIDALADVDVTPRATTRMKTRTRIGANGKLSVDDLVTLRSVGVTPAYIEEMRGAGLGELSLDDIVGLRVQGITPAYVRSLRDAGLEVSSPDAAISLRVQGVSGEYVKQMAAAGYPHLTTRELVELRVMGVNPGFVKSLADAGYTNLSVKELVRLKASGVDADFIRELSKYRSK